MSRGNHMSRNLLEGHSAIIYNDVMIRYTTELVLSCITYICMYIYIYIYIYLFICYIICAI